MHMQDLNTNRNQIFALDAEAIVTTVQRIQDDLNLLPGLNLPSLKADETAIIIIDMINGFALEGSLASPRVGALIEPISNLIEKCQGMKKVFVCDRHSENAAEFSSYLPHAVEGTEEALIVEVLYKLQDAQTSVIFKNSTNGMMTHEMQAYLAANPEINNFILVGDCTDICVLQFALSLKTYFNEINVQKQVIVPMNLVDTFELEVTAHDGDLMNLFAFYNMKMNGIAIYSHINLI